MTQHPPPPPSYPYPMYPRQPPPGPPRQRNTGLVVVILVGLLVLGGTAVGLAFALTGSSDDDSRSAAGSSENSDSGTGGDEREAPTSAVPPKLPPACELLSKTQLAAVIPGTIPEPFSAPPAPAGEGQVETRCQWRNDPFAGDAQVPSAAVMVRVTATSTEDQARSNFEISGNCDSPDAKKAPVTGADEACLRYLSREADTGNPVGDSVVVARSNTVVVEVQYNHSSKPIDQIEDVAITGAAAVLGKLLEAVR